MADRVVMGMKNGRMGFWVAPPGGDASSETQRMTLNSDLDFLQIYDSTTMVLNGYRIDPVQYGYTFDPVTFSFPDFGYIPLVFLGTSKGKAISIPLLSTELNENTAEPYYVDYHVYSDKVVWPGIEYNGGTSTLRLTCTIFKNKLCDAV